jgi:hypothetical protein
MKWDHWWRSLVWNPLDGVPLISSPGGGPIETVHWRGPFKAVPWRVPRRWSTFGIPCRGFPPMIYLEGFRWIGCCKWSPLDVLIWRCFPLLSACSSPGSFLLEWVPWTWSLGSGSFEFGPLDGVPSSVDRGGVPWKTSPGWCSLRSLPLRLSSRGPFMRFPGKDLLYWFPWNRFPAGDSFVFFPWS